MTTSSTPAMTLQWCRHSCNRQSAYTGVATGRSAVTDTLIPDEDVSRDHVPIAAALVRDFVNTVDHEVGTDELATTEGLTTFLVRHRLLVDGSPAREHDRRASVRLRGGLHDALGL